jgi:pterin-4a-carbinolamine dehydratase
MTRGPDDCAQRPVDRVRPAWSNVYNRVVVDLTTHEAGGITQKDLDLAREMEEMARSI